MWKKQDKRFDELTDLIRNLILPHFDPVDASSHDNFPMNGIKQGCSKSGACLEARLDSETFEADNVFGEMYETSSDAKCVLGIGVNAEPKFIDEIVESEDVGGSNLLDHMPENIDIVTTKFSCPVGSTLVLEPTELITHTDKCFLLTRYLFLFLKFVASVIPTIEYDCTMDFDLGSTST